MGTPALPADRHGRPAVHTFGASTHLVPGVNFRDLLPKRIGTVPILFSFSPSAKKAISAKKMPVCRNSPSENILLKLFWRNDLTSNK